MSDNTSSFLVADDMDSDLVSGPSDIPGETISVKRSNPLSQLKAKLKESVSKPDVIVAVPGREGISMIYSAELDAELLEAYQLRCVKKHRNTERLDDMKFAGLVLTKLSKGLMLEGEEVKDEDGKPFALWNPALADFLGVVSTSPSAVIRGLYGFDGHVLTTLKEVLKEAGFDDQVSLEVDSEDPTFRS